MYLSCFFWGFLSSLFAETTKRVVILMMTNVIVKIANQIQKLYFFEVGKKCRMMIQNRIRWWCDMGFCIFVSERGILCRFIIKYFH